MWSSIPPSRHETRNIDIEFLRAIAIIVTLVAHVPTLVPQWEAQLTYFWLGIGVDLFFAISGYVITSSFMRRATAAQNTGWLKFARVSWTRRIFRLWPAALFWSTLTLAVAFVVNDPGSLGARADVLTTWAASLLQLTNAHLTACNWFKVYSCRPDPLWHYWSLALEEQFYFVFPMLVAVLRGRLWMIAAVLAAWQAMLVRPWASPLWFFRTDALMWGVAIGAWFAGDRQRHADWLDMLESKWPRRIATTGLLLLLLFVSRPTGSPYYMGLVGAVAGAIVWLASSDRNLFASNWFSRELARLVGSRSYSLYLTHLPAFAAVKLASTKLLGAAPVGAVPSLALTSIGFGLSFLLAEFSFRVIEAPLRSYGKRLTDTLDISDIDVSQPPDIGSPRHA